MHWIFEKQVCGTGDQKKDYARPSVSSPARLTSPHYSLKYYIGPYTTIILLLLYIQQVLGTPTITAAFSRCGIIDSPGDNSCLRRSEIIHEVTTGDLRPAL